MKNDIFSVVFGPLKGINTPAWLKKFLDGYLERAEKILGLPKKQILKQFHPMEKGYSEVEIKTDNPKFRSAWIVSLQRLLNKQPPPICVRSCRGLLTL